MVESHVLKKFSQTWGLWATHVCLCFHSKFEWHTASTGPPKQKLLPHLAFISKLNPTTICSIQLFLYDLQIHCRDSTWWPRSSHKDLRGFQGIFDFLQRPCLSYLKYLQKASLRFTPNSVCVCVLIFWHKICSGSLVNLALINLLLPA
jgi:hypothetical protein